MDDYLEGLLNGAEITTRDKQGQLLNSYQLLNNIAEAWCQLSYNIQNMIANKLMQI